MCSRLAPAETQACFQGQILQAELFQVAWTLEACCSLIVDVCEGVLQGNLKHLPLHFEKEPWVALLGIGPL